MTDADRRAVIAEIAEMLCCVDRGTLPEPNFTAAEMAAEMNVSPDAALRKLRRLERLGVLQSQLIIIEGHRRAVFWKAGE